MKVTFVLPGPPVAKGRPRFSNQGGFVRSYTPKKTAEYETLVRFAYIEASKNIIFPEDSNLSIKIKAYIQIPKSVSKKKHKEMAEGKLRPLKKPDTDNIVKAVLDGLNTVAFHDDSQVTDIYAGKWYSDQPRIEVELEEVS